MRFAGNIGHCANGSKSLGIDQACLSIVNLNNYSVNLLSTVSECYQCDGQPWADLPPNSNTSLIVSTKYPVHMYYINSQDHYQYCHTTFNFQQHGHYGWNITDGSCSSIFNIYTPPNPYMPLLAAFMLFFATAFVYTISFEILKMWRGVSNREQLNNESLSDLGSLQEPEQQVQQVMRIRKSTMRIHSIDTFRGLAVLLMIFVNNGGGKYVFFSHSPWNGLTPADLVLPWFAWIMGFTIVISMRTQVRISISRGRIILQCLQRSLILILLGLMINSQHKEKTLSNLRIFGILQLLGITYFVVASVETMFMKAQRSFQFGRFMFLQDILANWVQWLIMLAIIALHTCLTFLLRVPGCPRGYLGPGGNHHHGQYSNCTAGAAGYIDRLILGNHTYSKTINPVYGPTSRHDPEGIMNTMSAVLIVFLGVQAGRIFIMYYQFSSKAARWFAWSVFTGVIAGALCNFSKESGVIPVNKNMMSLSFVLATSSMAFLLYGFLHYLIDHRKVWSGAPFNFAGINPIVLYVGHYVTMGLFPWSWEPIGAFDHTSVLAINLWTTILWLLIAYGLYRKDVVITI